MEDEYVGRPARRRGATIISRMEKTYRAPDNCLSDPRDIGFRQITWHVGPIASSSRKRETGLRFCATISLSLSLSVCLSLSLSLSLFSLSLSLSLDCSVPRLTANRYPVIELAVVVIRYLLNYSNVFGISADLVPRSLIFRFFMLRYITVYHVIPIEYMTCPAECWTIQYIFRN